LVPRCALEHETIDVDGLLREDVDDVEWVEGAWRHLGPLGCSEPVNDDAIDVVRAEEIVEDRPPVLPGTRPQEIEDIGGSLGIAAQANEAAPLDADQRPYREPIVRASPRVDEWRREVENDLDASPVRVVDDWTNPVGELGLIDRAEIRTRLPLGDVPPRVQNDVPWPKVGEVLRDEVDLLANVRFRVRHRIRVPGRPLIPEPRGLRARRVEPSHGGAIAIERRAWRLRAGQFDVEPRCRPQI